MLKPGLTHSIVKHGPAGVIFWEDNTDNIDDRFVLTAYKLPPYFWQGTKANIRHFRTSAPKAAGLYSMD